MGITVKVSKRNVDDLRPHVARAMLEAGQQVILPRAIELAPREPVAKHDVHGADTGFVDVTPTGGGYRCTVGFTAFWMRIQAQHPEWNHPNGGQSDFLLAAAVEGEDAFWQYVADATREAFAA